MKTLAVLILLATITCWSMKIKNKSYSISIFDKNPIIDPMIMMLLTMLSIMILAIAFVFYCP